MIRWFRDRSRLPVSWSGMADDLDTVERVDTALAVFSTSWDQKAYFESTEAVEEEAIRAYAAVRIIAVACTDNRVEREALLRQKPQLPPRASTFAQSEDASFDAEMISSADVVLDTLELFLGSIPSSYFSTIRAALQRPEA